jgi:two-component system NarL family sensor kinase
MLDELGEDVRAALADIRRLGDGLRPPALDELGLLGAIEQQARRLGADDAGARTAAAAEEVGPAATGEGVDRALRRAPRITVRGIPAPLPALPAAVEVAAYRIAIEAVTNVVRHAEATDCRVRIEASDALMVEVVDDGRGVPADVVPGIGLESIRARADELGGSWRIERRAEGGTRILARLPLPGASSAWHPGAAAP